MAKKRRKSSKTKQVDHLATYTFHGVDISSGSNGEATGTCPFCGKNKFYVNIKEGTFCCKSANTCGKTGNKYTFLQLFYDLSLSITTPAQYKSLARKRGDVSPDVFKDAELAYDAVMKRWIMPMRNESGSIVNLRVWSSKEKVPMSTAGCKLHLVNLEALEDNKTIYLCEGEWDGYCMDWLLKRNSKSKNNQSSGVVSVPGADQFKEEWAEKFKGKEVILLFDNDKAGRKGTNKTISHLQKHTKCTSIHSINWPDSLPEKYDINDYVAKHKGKPINALKRLQSYLVGSSVKLGRVKKDIVCKSFNSLVKEFRKYIHISDDMEDGILLICAVIVSNLIPGEPLWLFLVGPAGSGKTLLLQALGESENTVYQSSLGAKTLISGWNTSDGSDPSLLPRLIGKTLILKDYTELMSKPTGEQDEIYGQLRGAYDGHVARSYASGIIREYPEPGSGDSDCRFSILAGVTNAIHGDSRASLGERFIKYQMVAEDYNAIDQIRYAVDNTVKLRIPEEELRDAATSFIDYMSPLVDTSKLPEVPQWFINRIIGLSQLVATIRANVTRKLGELTFRPVPEVGTRLSKQLIRLGQCIAIILKKPKIDRACYSLVSRVAMDTCYGWHRDVILALTANPGADLQRMDLSKITQMSPTTMKRVLDDLIELKAVTFEESTVRSQGQPARIWDTSKEIKSLISLARLDDTQHIKKLLIASSQERKKTMKAKKRRQHVKEQETMGSTPKSTSKSSHRIHKKKKKGETITKNIKKRTRRKRIK